MRTSTGLLEAEPSTLPEHVAGCLIQVTPTRLTQCPLETVAVPDAPPPSRPFALEQWIAQRKLSGALSCSVTTSRNDPLGCTCAKPVVSAADGAASWRTSRAPYVLAVAGVVVAARAATAIAISAIGRCRIVVGTTLRLAEYRKLRRFDER
jgi:hypothetical protein